MGDVFHTYTVTYKGRDLKVDHVYDDLADVPWKRNEGHGPVSAWVTRNKRPSERVLSESGGSTMFYDMQEATEQAWDEGWGLCDDDVSKLREKLGREPKRGDIVHAAVERDFQFLRRWCDSDWCYMGVVVTDIETGCDESTWGIESECEDLVKEVTYDLCEQVYLPSIRALLTGSVA